MFETTHYHLSGIESVPYAKTVTINENRAPTDESVKLYDEFKQRAYDSIIDAFEVSDNAFNFKAFIYIDPCQYMITFRYISSINGKEIKGESQVSIDEYDRYEVVQKIIEDIAGQLAKQIVCSDSVLRDINKISMRL